MDTSSLSQTLLRLRQAADIAAFAWPVTRWTKLSGPGPDFLDQDGSGNFKGLAFQPGQDLTLAARLDLPAQVAGVSIVGDPLEATIGSLYPAEITWDEEPVFAEGGAPVAAGPALVTVIPALRAGSNGELRITVHIPNNQTTAWFNVRFTTPGLRARFELLDVAWAELTWAQALATTDEEQAALLRAAALVPENLAAFDERGLARVESELAPLAGKAAQHTVHVIGHSHIDMNWLWTWADTNNVIYRDFKSVVALMDDYPELTFTHSQPATYENIRIQAPELFARVVEFIKQGRWEPATLTWVEGDTNMASGEATARHMLESVRFSREYLGANPSSLLAPDTFGHAGNLPQLAASAGAARYYHHRCNPGQGDRSLWPAYWWEGQDGTRLLAISTPSYNGNILARDLVESALRARKHGQADSLHFHGIGDHGGGPARQNLDALRRFQKHPLLPSACCSTLARYTQNLLESGAALPVHRGESSTVFEGCYTTHAEIKRFNRQGENLLCSADTLAGLAGIPADALQPAWRTVLFNQFHDILDGSAIHETYEKCAADFAEVSAAAGALTESALRVLESGLPAGQVAVTNPLGWEREDWVIVPGLTGSGAAALVGSHGQRCLGQYTPEGLGFAARVPAYGTVSYRVEDYDAERGSSQAAGDLLSAELAFAPTDNRHVDLLSEMQSDPPYYKIETPFFRVYLRRDSGILVSFYDKRAGRELVGYGMRRGSDYLDSARPDLALNVLQLDEEYPHGMSAWHLDEVHTTHSLLRGATTELVEAGPARLVFSVLHHLRTSTVRQFITFYRDLARVDFRTQVDWQELGSPEAGVPDLKIAFTAHLPEAQAWFETPFAAVQRPCDGQEVPALRWADVGGSEYGIAVLNDSKYAYDALGTRLRLTLVRSGYDPDAISDIGQHEICYSLFPHPADWRSAGVVRQAAGYNQPLLARLVKAGQPAAWDGWLPQVSGSAAVVPAVLKPACDGSGRVLRLYESCGQAGEVELRGFPPASRVWEVTVTEDKIAECPVLNGGVRLAFRPWQVRTVLVEE